MATPITVWQTQTGGAFQDAAKTAAWLNALRRNIVMYAFAQNLGKISVFSRLLLENSDSQPFQPDFIVQPVYGGLDATNQAAAQPQWIDATSGTINIQDFSADYMYAKFTPSVLGSTIRISLFEQAVMQSPNVIIDRLALKATESHLQMMYAFMNAIMGTKGTAENRFYGIFDLVDNGVYQPVYGQISRATYPWWNSPVFLATDYTGDNPPLYLVIKRALKDYAKNYGHIYGMPALGVTDYDTWQKITESFMQLERYVVGDIKETTDIRSYEIKAVEIDGVRIIPDAYLSTYEKTIGGQTKTCGRIFFVNFDYIRFTSASPFEFYVTDWQFELVNNKLSYVTAILFAGEFWTDRPRAHFRLDDIVLS